MDAVPVIVFGGMIPLLLVMAAFLLNGKGAFLISGYNTLPKEEQARYDKRALCRFTGWMLVAVAAFLLLLAAGTYFNVVWLIYCGTVGIILVSVGGAIYTNRGKRFRKKSDLDDFDRYVPSKSPASKKTATISIVISVVALIVVGALCYQGEKEPVVHMLDSGIQIEAMYGVKLDAADITGITLMEKSMSELGAGMRVNGYGGIGGTLKGNFRSEQLGETLLFVHKQSSPTILIACADGRDVYLSFRDSEKTRQLYREMLGWAD